MTTVLGVALASLAAPAQADTNSDAIGVPTADLVGVTVDAHPDAIVIAATAYGSFPRGGADYLILSTGVAGDVIGGTPGEVLSTGLSGAPTGVDGGDMTRVSFELRPPVGVGCLAFDFEFLSEEYPDWVGTAYNDVFTAELNTSDITKSGSDIIAPNSFVFDDDGKPISVNLVGFAEVPAGAPTRMNGTSGVLRATSPLTLDSNGHVNLILTLQDVGDSVLDSAVLIDSFQWLPPGCKAGTTTAETLTVAPSTVTGPAGTELCTTVAVADSDSKPVTGATVQIAWTGAVTSTTTVTTDAAGQAEVCSTLGHAGQATMTASLAALTGAAGFTWTNRPPQCADLAHEAPEGTATTLDAGAVATDLDGDTLTYAWDTDDDGAFDDGTGPTASLVFPLVGSYPFAVQISDGTDTITVPGVADILNVVPAPTVTPPVGPLDVTTKQLTTTGSFTDPGADTWTATVDYGDGTGPQPLALDPATKTFALSHAYGAVGQYTVTVAVSDQIGQSTGATSIEVIVPSVIPDTGAGPLATVLWALGALMLVCGGALMISREQVAAA
ncbi:MAG: PKD domain-containing protein [Propionibacteriaceae bacterium]|nr:PKD domain-containing protein [Propionibacteriaceae bacterium]